jgi:GntR family transcriptional repressor for pyruvate dehydrogenase complex
MQTFEPISSGNKSSISLAIASSIREAIASGKITTGEKLPPERDIAKMMGVSRSTVRTALKMLDGMGLIDIRHGSGIYVAGPDDSEKTSQRIAASLLLQKKPLWDLFEIRELLETQAAAWAARRATPQELDEMHHVYSDFEALLRTGELTGGQANEYDGKLHRLIAVAARNEVLLHVMDNLSVLMRDSRKVSIALPERTADAVLEMGRIVAAIESGDDKSASKEMQNHLRNGRKAFAKIEKRAAK